jgi:hypothetical protein
MHLPDDDAHPLYAQAMVDLRQVVQEVEARDLTHPYNVDIGRLETLRRALHREQHDFYLALLVASPVDRTRVRIEAQRRLVRDGEGGG